MVGIIKEMYGIQKWTKTNSLIIVFVSKKKYQLLKQCYHSQKSIQKAYSYVTGFWKTDQIVTQDPFHFIGPANSYTCTLHIHSAIGRLGWLVCFSRASFANPVIHDWDKGTHGECYMEDMSLKFNPVIGRRLLQHSTMFGLCLALLGGIASPNSPNGGFNLPPASHPPLPLLPPPL